MFLYRDIGYSSKLAFCALSVISDDFLIIQYIDKGTFFPAEIFRIISRWLGRSMGQISGQISVIWFKTQYRKNGQKFSKKTITRLQRPMGRNSFRLLLVSLSSTKWHMSDSKRSVTPGDLPSWESSKKQGETFVHQCLIF